MTNHESSAVSGHTEPLVCVLAYDGLCTFEFGIAVELFGLPRPEFGHWYRFGVVAIEPGPLRATGGVTIDAEYDLGVLSKADLIVVPGWRGAEAPVPEALCEALRAAYAGGARTMSICSGVFVLAAAGLLKGRRATTHWRYTETLAKTFPDVSVDQDVLFVEDGRVLTSAGSAAGLDLGLQVIRRDFGASAAASVARRLVLAAQRDGGQRQYAPRPEPRCRAGASLAELQERVRASLDEPWSIDRMAKTAGMSRRTLARRFAEENDTTPVAWLTAARVTRAAELLEESTAQLSDVSTACGFGSSETFRREFRRAMGISPVRYREQFGRKRVAREARR